VINPPEDRQPPMNPQLALRVAIIGGAALVMFAIIFFRLWFLQVLSGNQYEAQAAANIVQTIAVQAPRGQILDSSNRVMVDSDNEPAVVVEPQSLPVPITLTNYHGIDHPPAADLALYRRLASLLGLKNDETKCKIVGLKPPDGPGGTYRMPAVACTVAQDVTTHVAYSNATIATGVSGNLQAYLLERASLFKGVFPQEQSLRQYPFGSIGAQLFGTIGQITPVELKDSRFKGAGNSDSVGQSGLEFEYNQFLQGTDGTERVKVNAQGAFEGYEPGTAARAGYDLKLSINSGLETVGYQSLAESIARNSPDPAAGGAFVAMDPDNGQVLAMGSEPTYNPSVFTHPISQSTYDQMFGPTSGDPLINRAYQSVGPDGSTFKVITATAALQSGTWSTDQSYDDTGEFCPTPNDSASCIHNSGNAAYGVVNLEKAIQVSDDVFFYHLGDLLNADPVQYPNGGALQQWARQYGIGRSTGVDLPASADGNLPTPKWREGINALEAECDAAKGPYKYTDGTGGYSATPMAGYHRKAVTPGGSCGFAVYPFESWTVGDNINTAVGQGDVQVSPLQLAVVYSALANGGTIVTPHVGQDIQTATGQVVRRFDPAPKRHLDINPTYLDTILAGLHAAAQTPGGTSDDVMGNFKETVYAKTGTAQYITDGNEQDYAWYATFVPKTATSKPIVVVVWVPKAGFGDVAAAPVARQILSKWFFDKEGPFVEGKSTDQ
jgi:penicillin-binding protein 2